ncbi:MAG: YhbY family RNA-binding protein, partial [Clostridia bacterium]
MDSKTRAYLKGLAMKIQPTTQVGKNGITQNVLAQIDEVLEARELVKITVFKNSDIACKDIINELAQQLQ